MSYFCDLLIVVEHGQHDLTRAVATVAKSVGLSTRELSVDEALYIRRHLRLSADSTCIHISVERAQVLLEGRDFAPEYDSGFPASVADRIALLARFAESIVRSDWCRALALALTDSNEIEYVTGVGPDQLGEIVRRDCAAMSPPNGLFVSGRSVGPGELCVD